MDKVRDRFGDHAVDTGLTFRSRQNQHSKPRDGGKN
jgi:hypothetical protein